MKKKTAPVHNINDYALSIEICKDFEEIDKILNPCYNELQKHRKYRSIANILDVIFDECQVMAIHYEYYRDILKKKGRVDQDD